MSNSQYIFNRKMLDKKISHYQINSISDLENKKQIIKNWNYSIANSDLNKTKEEAIQGDFLTSFFVDILGYNKRYGNKVWNISQEQKTIVDGTKADGALGYFTSTINDIRVVIELKDANTDLDKKQKSRESKYSPVEQAFSYASKSGKKCKWVIVSNFREIRLYHSSDQSAYETFKIEELLDELMFTRFYYLLCKDNLINRESPSIIDNLYEQNETEQQLITKQFYLDYKDTRMSIFSHLKEFNDNVDELVLFEKTQKLLDRFIFICFCEDNELLPENIFRKVIQVAKQSFDISEVKIWNQLKGLFHSIDKGNDSLNINHFNGGLFKEDEILDNLIIKDDLLINLEKIAEYDFSSELDVNILGHIFEQSISDIEEIKAEIRGEIIEKKESKRKKNGIYYTPGYITKYLVKDVIGSWLDEKRIELGESSLPEIPEFTSKLKGGAKRSFNNAIKKHEDFWIKYSDVLANIKIIDPACGSGAFLNAAFDYLYQEGKKVNEKLAELTGGIPSFFDLDKQILKNNLFGMDLNPESVEITKLSLWLKTANKNETLTSLDNNIICGNSIIDTKNIWEDSFAEIFQDGGFDIILGNPPYVRQENLVAIKDYLADNYKTYSGRADLYVYFFEKSINILKPNGKLGFICSSKYTKASYGKKLRQFILENTKIKSFLDFGDLEVFPGVIAYPSIIILEKDPTNEKAKQKNQIQYCLFTQLTNNIANQLLNNGFYFEQGFLNSEEWIFKDVEYLKLFKKLNKKFSRLDNRLGSPKVGSKTGRNEAFIIDENLAEKFIELDENNSIIIKPYLFGENIKEYICNPKQYIIFPYIEKNNILELVDIELFPVVKEHLEHYRNVLEQRAIIKDGLKSGSKIWYEYQQVNKEFSFEKTYIVYPNVSKGNSFALSKGNAIDMTAFCIEIDPEDYYHLPILNSNVLNSFFRSVSIERRGGFREYKTQYVSKMPYPIPAKKDIAELKGLYKELFNNHKKVNNISMEIVSYLSSVYKIESSKTIQNWFNIPFGDFSEELKKQKIAIRSEEAFDLMKLMNSKKEEIININKENNHLENIAKSIIYSLYNMNVDDRKLIEDNQ